MAKSSKFERKEFKRPTGVHPVWRGIGLIMMIIVPIISWLAATELVQYGQEEGWPIVFGLPGAIAFPGWAYSTPGLSQFASWLGSIPNLPIRLVFFVMVVILFTGLFSSLYAVMYRIVGPPRYLPTDEPPMRGGRKNLSR